MKKVLAILTLTGLLLAGCHNSDNKPGESAPETPKPAIVDTAVDTNPATVPDSAGKSIKSPVEARKADKSAGPKEILAKIDAYIVSTPVFTATPGGGFTNASITVTNTLKDITFQKVYVQVLITDHNGKLLNANFYIVINLEPGMSKSVNIPNSSVGTKVTANIAKAKSDAINNGEWVLTGTSYGKQ